MGMKPGGGNIDYWSGQAPAQQKMMYPYSMSPLSSPQQPQHHMLPYQQPSMGGVPQSSQQQRYNMYMPAAPAPSSYYQGSGGAIGGSVSYGGLGQLDADKDPKRFNPSPYLQSERAPEQQQQSATGYSIVPPSDNSGHFGGEDSEELPPTALAVSSVPNGDHESHSRPPEGLMQHKIMLYIFFYPTF
jgi:hypothetical protein